MYGDFLPKIDASFFISVGAPNVKSPLKRSTVSAQISAGSRFRKSLLHGRLTKFLYAAITAAYKISNGVEKGLETAAEKSPSTLLILIALIVLALLAPVIWKLCTLLCKK